MTTNKIFRPLFIPCFAAVVAAAGCSKFVEIDPPVSQIISSDAFATDASATSVMLGLYINMMNGGSNLASGSSSYSMLQGLAADELTNYLPANQGAVLQQFYLNAPNAASGYYWGELFSRIYTCNTIIEGVTAAKGLSTAVSSQLLGEAKFMRALFFFYATNSYGAVPLALSSDYRANNELSRSPREKVYEQIVADLKDAQNLMGEPYFKGIRPGSTERARPNRGAATALLARVYLYMKDWANAEVQASSLIGNTGVYTLGTDLNTVFRGGSKEAIWQLQTVVPGNLATYDGFYFILSTKAPGTSNQNPVALSPRLLNAFETGDARRTSWVGVFTVNGTDYYYPFKYKNNVSTTPEYTMVLRLGEQYLIRAEARAQQGRLTGANSAKADLDSIRNRAALPLSTAATQTELLNAIAQERRVELFTEWGHRWFDLARTGRLNEVMQVEAPLKGGSWTSTRVLLPVPLGEKQLNPNLGQNEGYD